MFEIGPVRFHTELIDAFYKQSRGQTGERLHGLVVIQTLFACHSVHLLVLTSWDFICVTLQSDGDSLLIQAQR